MCFMVREKKNKLTWWTNSKVKELEQAADNHIDSCEDCQERLKEKPPEDDSPYYCSIGEGLSEISSEAGFDFSWQHNFDGHGSFESPGPGNGILCPCDTCFTKTMKDSGGQNGFTIHAEE